MQRIFTLSLVTAALIVLTTTVAAQDADNPWHLIVMNEDSIELSAFNVETLDNVSLSDGQVGIKMTWDSKSQNYSYPVASTFFAFEPRKNGTGTANEVLSTPVWNVYYANGRLHVSNPIGAIEIYSINGMKVGQYPNLPDIFVNLSPGLYIVRNGSQSAKLFVSASGIGGTTAQSVTKETQDATSAPDSPEINLRAATIKIYWNITAGSLTIPVEIPNVEKFHFTADNSIVFTLYNGNTMELADYKCVEFAIEPVLVTNSSKWDMEKTLTYGGARYVFDYGIDTYQGLCVIAVARDYIIADDPSKNILSNSVKYLQKDITYPHFLSKKLTMFFSSKHYTLKLAHFYIDMIDGDQLIFHKLYDSKDNNRSYDYGETTEYLNFNNGTIVIPTTTSLSTDGELVMKFSDFRDGKEYTYTFPVPTDL